MKLWSIVLAGWALVVWTAVDPHAFPLIGAGSLFATLLPGSQGFPGYEGIEAVWLVATLPALVAVIRGRE